MDEMKICSKCRNEKELSEFKIRTDTQKYRKQCRDCIKLMQKEHQTINKDKVNLYKKNYFQHNKNKIYEYRKTQKKNRR